jgi:hypothetical protein
MPLSGLTVSLSPRWLAYKNTKALRTSIIILSRRASRTHPLSVTSSHFKVNLTLIVINGTEWLSLKVYGQSFIMY